MGAMQDGIGEPPIEFFAAAAVARHDRRLRRAVGTVRWTDNPHMEVIIAPVPRAGRDRAWLSKVRPVSSFCTDAGK